MIDPWPTWAKRKPERPKAKPAAVAATGSSVSRRASSQAPTAAITKALATTRFSAVTAGSTVCSRFGG